MQGDTNRVYKKYLLVDEENRDEKQAACEHKVWIKRCSCCSMVLDSEHTHEEIEVEETYI